MAQPPLYVSGIAHPPPTNGGPDDLDPRVFQSQAFIHLLKQCGVTADSYHKHTEEAARIVLAAHGRLDGISARVMIDHLGKDTNTGTMGNVTDAWVSPDGALRVTMKLDKLSPFARNVITNGTMKGISISHHEQDGVFTPFEIALVHRPLRDGCRVGDINNPQKYKLISNLPRELL